MTQRDFLFFALGLLLPTLAWMLKGLYVASHALAALKFVERRRKP